MKRAPSTVWLVWRWPLVLAVLTIGGLLLALLGDDMASQRWSWAALTMPLLVVGWCLLRRRG